MQKVYSIQQKNIRIHGLYVIFVINIPAMLINRNINIKDDKLSNGLKEVLIIIDQIQNSPDPEHIIDFNNTSFVTPTFVLPLMVFAKGCGKSIHFKNITPYMSLLYFGEGILPDDIRKAEFIAKMEAYAGKTYTPVINFPATENRIDDKNNILTTVESIITRQIGLSSNVIMGIKYMIGEMVDNITEHSNSERGYILAQAYPTKNIWTSVSLIQEFPYSEVIKSFRIMKLLRTSKLYKLQTGVFPLKICRMQKIGAMALLLPGIC